MYSEKLEKILVDLENSKIHLAGGSAVGMVLSIVNSLIKYASNLSLGKKKYENIQEQIEEIIKKADALKANSMKVIDEDKEILEEILKAYKTKQDDEKKYELICKKSTDFCMDVVLLSYESLKLSDQISKIGNNLLESDFKICKYYSEASIKAAIENVKINAKEVRDKQYISQTKKMCDDILEKAKLLM